MTHRQPVDLILPSRPLPRPCLAFAASSSSTTSWGLTLMCRTFGDSVLNRQSGTHMRVRNLGFATSGGDRKAAASVPFNCALSSNSLPNCISRIELGLVGLGSHSTRSRHGQQFSPPPRLCCTQEG